MRVPSAEVQNPMRWLSFIGRGYRNNDQRNRAA